MEADGANPQWSGRCRQETFFRLEVDGLGRLLEKSATAVPRPAARPPTSLATHQELKLGPSPRYATSLNSYSITACPARLSVPSVQGARKLDASQLFQPRETSTHAPNESHNRGSSASAGKSPSADPTKTARRHHCHQPYQKMNPIHSKPAG